MRPDLLDTDPITLAEASKLVLRGAVKVSALRAEIRRGNLRVARIGKNLFTTPRDIREMWNRCLVNQAPRDSTSVQTTEPGSSGTKARTTELDALRESVRRLKSGLLPTSQRNTQTNPQSAANPIPFPSQKC